jgi:hypothetical protein
VGQKKQSNASLPMASGMQQLRIFPAVSVF